MSRAGERMGKESLLQCRGRGHSCPQQRWNAEGQAFGCRYGQECPRSGDGGVQKRRPVRYMALSPALVSIIPFEMACRVNPATS